MNNPPRERTDPGRKPVPSPQEGHNFPWLTPRMVKTPRDCIPIYTHMYLFAGIFFPSSPEDMFIDLREREGNINVREKYQLVASHMCPDQGSNPQPRYMPDQGLNPRPFWYTGQHSYQLSHPARALAFLK